MKPPAAGAALVVDGLDLRFGAVQALSELSFDVRSGELFAVIGPNGAGKSSLFNLLSRTYHPTRGRITYFGRDLLALRAHQLAGAGIARTFQNLGLFGPLTALDNVVIGRTSLGRSGIVSSGLRLPRARREDREHRAAALEALRTVGAADVADRPVGLLPYGVQKRVEIARALAMQPKLLLLDEPVAGMSRDERSSIAELVGRLNRERGITTMLVEHDMGVVMGLATRVLVLDFGRPVAIGTPAEIQANPEVIRAYLGETAELSR
ncbi:MAG TPA: ABC transporter ATP-binding protein [Acidimicrobiales bacterium]|nr:ABC transporter ATP-binding protein [Acidimicrobiales bacterium]